MSQQLRDALAQAADAGRAQFDARDAAEVVSPAAARVRRQRAMMSTAGVLSVAVVVGGVAWAFGTSGLPGPNTGEPVGPAGVTQSPYVPTSEPHVNSWSTLQLAAVAEPRKPDEKRADSAAGVICHHNRPVDDPRVYLSESKDVTMSHARFFVDCTPVWFKKGPLTSTLSAGSSIADGSVLDAHAVVRNDSPNAITLDLESVVMWVETAPGTASAGADETYTGAVVGPTMWDSNGYVQMLLDSGTTMKTLEPGDTFTAHATASAIQGANSLLEQIISTGAPYTVTFWARIHEESPHGDATYLIQLGTAQHYPAAMS